MKPLSEITIDIGELDNLVRKAMEMENFNPACCAVKYWKSRMNLQVRAVLREKKRLPYGYVGDGWPNKAKQTWAIAHDKRHLFEAFSHEDWDTRDVGDAVYQANVILDLLSKNSLSIVDIGGGYGRLAIPFLHWSKAVSLPMKYYSVDYIPESILIAPQVIAQMVGTGSFQEVPAWQIDTLKDKKHDVFISVHSFQEMERKTVDFYVQFMNKFKGSLLYSINIWPTDPYVPNEWELILTRGFPINRDGSYSEKVWRIR